MAFFITPSYQTSHFGPFGLGGPAYRPVHRYRGICSQPRRPQSSSFGQFFDQMGELLGEIDQQAHHQAQLEAQRQLRCQRQQRKRALRAQFAVSQTELGWQVEGQFQGFEQQNLNIEATSEYTLRITGNTAWQSNDVPASKDVTSATEQITEKPKDGETIAETPNEVEITTAVAPDSDTESQKSYQATVEDDFEDLGAETASLISVSSGSSTVSDSEDTEHKEEAAKDVETPQPAVSAQPQEEPEKQKPCHGSFERTFRFPERIDAANVRASFNDGILRVEVPRAPVQQVRKIAIR